MKKRVCWLLICVVGPLVLFFVPLTAVTLTISSPVSSLSNKIDPELQEAMIAQPDGTFRFIIHLEETADFADLPTDKLTRRVELVARLQQTAESSQAELVQNLESMKTAGDIISHQSLWIINAVAAHGTTKAIQTISARPEVQSITLDEQHRYFDPPQHPFNLETLLQAPPPDTTQSWGIERVRAFQSWHGLGIDGTNTTVAIMDSGVDWLHPLLLPNYRGNLGGGNVNHSGNWYYAPDPTQTEPFDILGHGTHVAGTAVGQEGIGVAPGAKWIAVSITDEYGLIYNSAVHAGFQWILAPNGNTALAPDVVNNSWGGDGTFITFLPDVITLQQAGIIPVFAAGNTGPWEGSVNSPASYPDTLAVGASDDIDTVAWFSSRGPSPLTNEFKPWIVAPGTHIYSAYPGNRYAYAYGTSMATPHVVGAIALLLSANPSLTPDGVNNILAETAVPLSTTLPNNDSGWGMLDVYSAVSQETVVGTLQGNLFGGGNLLPGTAITITTPDGIPLAFQTDTTGYYQAALRPGTYSFTVAPFGYAPYTQTGIVVNANQNSNFSVSLTPLPTGTIQGTVREAGSNLPLTATVQVLNTPMMVQANHNGQYNLSLPAGTYQLLVSHLGHRLGRATIQIMVNQTTGRNFTLATAPNLLLVDSGQWYYFTQAAYYEKSLTDLDYAFDLQTIRNPFQDIPTTEDLLNYDTVIWSNPLDSPGVLGTNNIITDYLGAGGNLLISGQDIGLYDGTGFDVEIWWYRDLEAQWLGKTAVTQTITGADNTIFSGISLSLNGPESAANQVATDRVRPSPGSLSQPIFYYENGQVAGLQAGLCDPFRIVYLGFGLEGTGTAVRSEIIDTSLDYFASPRQTYGAQWKPGEVDDFAVPGHQLVYTITLQNMSETMTDTFGLNVNGNTWAADLLTSTLTLGPCQQGQTVLTLDIPAGLPINTYHQMEVTAVSANTGTTLAHLVMQHKTPGLILMVDDDRWYDQENIYQAALDNMGLQYDVWDTNSSISVADSPYQDLLNAYDMVIWYTGYDWYSPIIPAEVELLTNYLAQGGRVFLNSQDFLYYNRQSPLAKQYFGVADYYESITPTIAFGGSFPALTGVVSDVLPLDYSPYQNFSDGLIPAPGSQVFLWHNEGSGGLANTNGNWRSLFWGFPWETLPAESQEAAMNGAVGWLSDLGDSSFEVDKRVSHPGEPRTYTITLRNTAVSANHVFITNTLPVSLQPDLGSVTGGAIYNPTTHQFTWEGDLPTGGSHVIQYQATPAAVEPGSRVDNHLSIFYERHHLGFDRVATTWLNAPDLSQSFLSLDLDQPFTPTIFTYTLHLANSGLAAADVVSAVVRLPNELSPLTDTLSSSAGTGILSDTHHLVWTGNLDVGAAVTISLVLTHTISAEPDWLMATAVIQDGITDTIVRSHQLFLLPYPQYLPLIARKP